MSVTEVSWKGHCRDAEARYRLLSYLHRLALLSDGYLQMRERPALSLVGTTPAHRPRPNIEVFDERRKGPIFVSSSIGPHPETLLERAAEAGLKTVTPEGLGDESIRLDELRLRGLDFKLFDSNELLDVEAHHRDRMSFVFLECPEHRFLDGRLVDVERRDDLLHLTSPHIQLGSDLEDWTDCLFAWIRFFLMGDFWWRRHEELQGYADYRSVFEELQTSVGSREAEDATFDAVLSTFTQHVEHSIGERLPTKAGLV